MATTRATGFGVTAAIWNALFTNLTDAGVWQGFTWSTRSFAAGNYTGNGSMTVTVASGDVTAEAYVELGKTMLLSVQLDGVSISGTPSTEIRITVPNGRTIQRNTFAAAAWVLDNGTLRPAFVQAGASTTYVSVIRGDLAAWTASTNNTNIYFQILVQID